MKKFFDLLKTEYIKNMSLKKFFIILIILILSSLTIFKLSEKMYITFSNYSSHWRISKDDVDRYKLNYEKSKMDFQEDANYETYLEMVKNEKFLKLYEMMYQKGYLNPTSNMNEVYNDIIELNNILPEDEAIINGYKEAVDIDAVKDEYAKLKEKYDVALNVLETKNVYELKRLNLPEYQEKLDKLKQEKDDSKDRLIEYKIYYYEQKIKLINYLVDNKITTDDWQYALSTNINFYLAICSISIPYEEEMDNNYYGFNSYDDYVNSYIVKIKEAQDDVNLLFTILDNNIRPIVKSSNPSDVIMSYDMRIGFNNIYYIGIVILVITCISLGGIVAHEHKTGSIRLLLANPFKRRKVLLSKFVYLILSALTMYLLSLLIFIIIMLVTDNIESLLVPQLIINGNTIIQTNYLLFIIKNMAIHFIFMSLILTTIFFVSTLFLNVSFTVGIATSIILISSFIPVIMVNIKFSKIFSYIPIIFLNYAKYMSDNPMYNLLQEEENNIYSNISISNCMITSIIMIIIMLLITNIIYKKRDVKN